jgi:hypothetical protein
MWSLQNSTLAAIACDVCFAQVEHKELLIYICLLTSLIGTRVAQSVQWLGCGMDNCDSIRGKG